MTPITALPGCPVARYPARSPSRRRHLIFLGIVATLLVGIIVRMLGWTIILGNEGLVNAALRGPGVIDEPR